MANLFKAQTNHFIDSILPTYGQKRLPLPIWNEGQKMFLGQQFKSKSESFYYSGLRTCGNIAIVERVGLYYSFTYIDSIEIYVFDSTSAVLVQKKDFDKKHYKQNEIRGEIKALIQSYIESCYKLSGQPVDNAEIEKKSEEIVEQSYKSYLDKDYDPRLLNLLPLINSDYHKLENKQV